ncbi:ABC transporter permease [Sandarakinorhabdus sp. AAP62]|uniref:ABC transporter permease n=1 Tax=Sandarakinorhabdus sp. AAP62 TaxID=1248916 RepID=UPI0002D2A146|nr:ABC transporter permease [Sandarakinorhabdus sp. AAP62]
MTALAQVLSAPGSLPWLVLHDVRVKARGRQGRWGRMIAIALLAALPVLGGAVLAWRVRGGADLPQAALGLVGAVLLGMMLVMISSAYAHVLRLGRDRGELELLLTAPLPVTRVVAARVAGVQAVVALPFLILTGPFFLFSALFGHVGWLAGPLVVIANALVATALALSIATLLDRLLGQARAKLVAQAMGVCLAGGVFALGQAPNFAPRWFDAQLAFFSQRPPAPLDWPAQAVFGQPLQLIAVLALALAATQCSAWLAAGRMEAAPVDPMAANAPAAPRRRGAVRFGGSAFAALFGKELKLLGRDPELISQIGQQLVFMVPILALIFTDGQVTPARLAAAGVFLAGALSSSLAWLVLCAEDAPDLIAAAPLRPGMAIRAKLAAALTPPLLMVSALALLVLPKSPLAVAVMLPMALVAGLASAAMQAWTQPPARRSAFRKRYRSSLLMAVGEFVLLGSLAGATRLLLAGSWWTLAALAVPAVMLAGVWWFRLKPAE